jgi:hypothetical protein
MTTNHASNTNKESDSKPILQLGLLNDSVSSFHSCRWLPTAVARVRARVRVIWDLWWTKWHCGRFSQGTSVSPANIHSTNCSTTPSSIYYLGLVQQANSGRSTKWTQSHPTNDDDDNNNNNDAVSPTENISVERDRSTIMNGEEIRIWKEAVTEFNRRIRRKF